MRILTLTLITLFFTAQGAMAEPLTKEMAKSFYDNCLLKESSDKLTRESQDMLCACTASKMLENMDTDDIRAMTSQDPVEARLAVNHMITKVYAPCMEHPTKDHYYNTCITNPKTKTLGGDTEKLCRCMSSKVGIYLGKNGEEVFTEILKRNPNVGDPMAALEGDSKFQNYVGKQLMSCVL